MRQTIGRTLMPERIQKALARMGLGSRREIERWIDVGFITQKNRPVALGVQVSAGDEVWVQGKKVIISAVETALPEVLIYHKPVGEICSRADSKHENTVFDHLPKPKTGRWVMVGRLDLNTQGLLMFTNDGELAARLMHPRYQIKREYAVRVLGEVSVEMITQLKKGVMLDDGLAKFESINHQNGEGANQWYRVSLREGRKREVRRLFESQGLTVSRLMRVSYGTVSLPRDLKPRQKQFLQIGQIKELMTSVGL